MRRFMSAALLALFVLQSSGAAMAAPPASMAEPSLLGQMQFAFTQLVDTFESTEIGALMTGKLSRYQLMHMPEPKAPRIGYHRPLIMRRPAYAYLVHRGGTRVFTVVPRPIDPLHAPLDKRAMKKSGNVVRASAIPSRTLRVPMMQPLVQQALIPTPHPLVTPPQIVRCRFCPIAGVKRAVSPADVHAPPMPPTAVLPSSAMRPARRTMTTVQTLNWTQLSGSGTQVASGDGSLWVLDSQPAGADKYVWHYANGTWTNISGTASQLAVSPSGELYAINSSGGVYAYAGGTWTTLGGGASSITVGTDGSVYVTGNATPGADNAVWRYQGGSWTQMPGSGILVAASPDQGTYHLPGGTLSPGGFYILNAAGAIYYENLDGSMIGLPGTASALAPTTNGGLFALAYPRSGDASLYYLDLNTGTWSAQSGSGSSIAADGADLYIANSSDQLFSTGNASALAPDTTGVNPWWTYEEGAIPGLGKYMVNVANGNLLIQADDVDVHERGIDLAFRRTYNAQSQHDAANTDGSVPSNYGDKWTNTFDAHIAFAANDTVISVYDIDGARYDYRADGNGHWIAPAGEHSSLDANGNCYYQWTKKTGTSYEFYTPNYVSSGCGSQNVGGRLAKISARNSNNAITFSYTLDSNGEPTEIDAIHSDTQRLTLVFGVPANGMHEELSYITRPDGQAVHYLYSQQNPTQLIEVDRPGNGVATATAPAPNQLPETYTYLGTMLHCAAGPRFTLASWSSGGNPQDGSQVCFDYDSSTRVLDAYDDGTVNFTPQNDTVGEPLQSAPSGRQTWREAFFSGYGTGTTTFNDTDGHASTWLVDSRGRVTQSQQWVSSTFDLITNAAWDTDNNLISQTDPRGYETDYAYDGNGNTVKVALAAPSGPAPVGSGARPTSLYSYDAYNNVTAFCDPIRTQQLGQDWDATGRPSPTDVNIDALCLPQAGAVRYTWTTDNGGQDASEPYGRLTDTYTAAYGSGSQTDPGYHVHITYDAAQEGAIDAGLPTTVQGDPYGQTDGTTRQPTQTFTYNNDGNLVAYSKGNGNYTLAYDNLNQALSVTDPDNVTTYTCYYLNGQTQYTETAAQHALDGSAASCQSNSPAYADSHVYDADGDEVTSIAHYNQTPSTGETSGETIKWYDGFDRVVEVEQPQDPSYDVYQFPSLTRYIYDLSRNGTVSLGTASFHAYGNLYKTQQCLQGTGVAVPGRAGPLSNPIVTGSCTFTDVRGNSFDALDRGIAKYELAAGTAPEVTSAYDTGSQYGLLVQTSNAMGQTNTRSYDDDGRLTAETFNDGQTANRTYEFDADGRITTLTSAITGSETHAYDTDGRLIQTTSPNAVADNSVTSYGYYPDGTRASLSLSISGVALNATNLFQYAYRPDGLRTSLVVNGLGQHGTFAWTYTSAGRELTESDPLTGGALPAPGGGSNTTYVPLSYSYDSDGRISSETLPRGFSYSTFSFDAEGNALTWNTSAQSARADYTKSNQLADNYTYNTSNESRVFADGDTCSISVGSDTTASTCELDSRSGQLQSSDSRSLSRGQCSDCMGGWLVEHFDSTHQYTYDASGREVADASNSCSVTYSSSPDIYPLYTEPTVTSSRSYDADNHLLKQTLPAKYVGGNPACSASMHPDKSNYGSKSDDERDYVWGADGHLAATTDTTTYDGSSSSNNATIGWDGNTVLYETNGTQTAIYIEKLGYLAGSGTTGGWAVYDRDWYGATANIHEAGYFSAVTDQDATHSSCTMYQHLEPSSLHCQSYSAVSSEGGNSCSSTTCNPPAGSPYFGSAWLNPVRADGYTDGVNVFQGVRAYDPNMSQWTTPDAYAGNVHDPMTQKPYMWNNNNPIAYSDPSGYVGEENEQEELPEEASAGYLANEETAEGTQIEREMTPRFRARLKAALRAGTIRSPRIRSIIRRALQGRYPLKSGSSEGRAGGNFPRSMVRAIRSGICSACGRFSTVNQGDHVLPRSLGGGNTIDNLDRLCNVCNPSKGARGPLQWLDDLLKNHGH